MATLIVAFPKIEEAKAIKNLLVRKGYDVAIPCTTGAQIINQADVLSDGIIICGYKLSDNMLYSEVYDCKPKSFELLLVASRNLWENCQDNDIDEDSRNIGILAYRFSTTDQQNYNMWESAILNKYYDKTDENHNPFKFNQSSL